MTSPAMVILNEDAQEYKFYYMTTTKSRVNVTKDLDSRLIEYDSSVTQDIRDEKVGSSMNRFQTIARYFTSHMIAKGVGHVFLEGYSLGSKGKVFSIAENTAVLKMYLMKMEVPVTIIPPTVIKKWATGRGNANKRDMKEAYERRVRAHWLAPISHYKDSPYTDCIDAYWILHCGLDKLKQKD